MNALKEKSDRSELRFTGALEKLNDALARQIQAEQDLARARVDYSFFLGQYLEEFKLYADARKEYVNSRLETK